MEKLEGKRTQSCAPERIRQFIAGCRAFNSLQQSLGPIMPMKFYSQPSIPGWDALPINANFTTHLLDSALLVDKHVRVTPDTTMLDMGVGDGNALAFLAGSLGIEGYGIELNNQITRFANLRFMQLRAYGWLRQECRAYSGNYFPDDFEIDERSKWLDVSPAKRKQLETDAYKNMGHTLHDFDIIYFYQYIFNSDSTLRLLSEHVKQGTFIIFADYGQYSPLEVIIPKNLQLVERLNWPGLFVKT